MIKILAVCLLVILGTRATFAAPATQPANSSPATHPSALQKNLFGHGSKEFIWVAHVTANPEGPASPEQTRIDFRPAGAEAWQHLTEVPARTIALANLQGQVAVLLEGGDWKLYDNEGDGSTGQPLPGEQRIITFASDGDSLWAIGLSPGGPTTAPTTSATTTPATTQATTFPAEISGPHLALFSLKGSTWTPAGGAAIPTDISAETPLSLAVIDNAPYLAVERANHTIEVLRLSAGGSQSIAQVPAAVQSGAFQLLSGLSPATLWVAGDGADELKVISPGSEVKTVSLQKISAPIPERTAVYAMNNIREIAIIDGKMVEQNYNPQTYAAEKGTTVALPTSTTPPYASPLFRIGLFIALAFAIFSSARRRRDLKEAAPELQNLVLADLARRLVAGLIDAIPFAAPIAVIIQDVHHGGFSSLDAATTSPAGPPTFWLFMAAMFVYLLHTAASETLSGRTLGKWIMGLRVVRLDGTTPDPVALLTRNFLRVVDIGLAGVPLIFIAFSPLRQRIGDVAAGTVVIRDRVKPEGNLVEPPVEPEVPTSAPPQSDAEPPPAG